MKGGYIMNPNTIKKTGFDPIRHGYRFQNTFSNDFIRELDVRTSGLCGGMVYSALDYYLNHKPIPTQYHRPAVHTPLHDYIYDRQVQSIIDNLDKWAELGFNPFGARNSEFFRWGLQGFDGGRLQELCEMIDRGRPVPLGLQTYDGSPGNHQVLAIGCDLGRYRGDLRNHKEDLKIFIYDPNSPLKTMTLVPELQNEAYCYKEKPHKQWRTYFVDKKYHVHSPPTIASERPTSADGLVGELLLHIWTGDDDLRGGNDNLNVTVNVRGKAPQHILNVNRGRRWIDNYDQTVRIRLNQSAPLQDVNSIVLNTTFSGGMGGDNWNMHRLCVTARGRGINQLVYDKTGHPLFRFTGDNKEFAARLTGRG